MGQKNRRPDLNGIIILNKPLTWTSARACRAVRNASGGAKVGHAGTLDPLATGVLLVCLGKATKSINALMATEKRYTADIDLAHTSPTDDLESAPIPAAIAHIPTLDQLRAACNTFVGDIQQTPPNHSAIQIGGRRAYDFARKGEDPALQPRTVTIHEINILSYTFPVATLDIRCGKGTYIRSLARDLGRTLNTGGMLKGLIRTAVGPYTIDHALDGNTLTSAQVEANLIPVPTPAPDSAPPPLGRG